MKLFNKDVLKGLGHYVYALIDPRDGSIFYVGKASGTDRAESHLKSKKTEHKKNRRISEIREAADTDNKRLEPRVEIIRFGLCSSESAHEVESAVIDTLGLQNLTNEVHGHGIEHGRLSAEEAKRRLGSKPINLDKCKEKLMLFFIHQTYSPTLTEQDLYDATRQFWYRVSSATRTPASDGSGLPIKTALAVVDSVVVRVYSILAWFPAGATLSSRKRRGDGDNLNKWEFVGNLESNHELLGRRLQRAGKDIVALEQGFGYANPLDKG